MDLIGISETFNKSAWLFGFGSEMMHAGANSSCAAMVRFRSADGANCLLIEVEPLSENRKETKQHTQQQ